MYTVQCAPLSQAAIWRSRLVEAEQRYRQAVCELGRLKDMPGSDPVAVARVAERRAATRHEYRQILHTFTDLIVRGIPPPDGGPQTR